MDIAVGDTIEVTTLHADGQAYRWWQATVECLDGERIVTFARAGHQMHRPDGAWISRWHVRTHYWTNRPYNLLEVYHSDGQLQEIYINIASPATLEGRRLTFIDHELDVCMVPGEAPRVVDEDEFAVAVGYYGYSPEFQRHAYHAVEEAKLLAEGWQAAGVPLE